MSPQLPPGFSLPAITHVDRNWFVMSNDPIGSVVTKVYSDRTGTQNVKYGLETFGPPTPFKIDPVSGIVTVNDTLKDKVNINYVKRNSCNALNNTVKIIILYIAFFCFFLS